MNNQQRTAGLIAILSACAIAQIATAQPAANQASPAPKAMQASHAAEAAKPQVVYNVPSRQTAEALHAQSKVPGDVSLPVDGNMPISLQLSRSNANAEAAGVRVAQPTPTEARAEHHGKRRKSESANEVAPPAGGPNQLNATPVPRIHGQGHGHGESRGHGKHHGN